MDRTANSYRSDFVVDDLVFAKVKGYKHWPAKITSLNKKGKVLKYGVLFFGTHETAILTKESIVIYNEMSKEKYGKIENMTKIWKKSFGDSMEEIENTAPCLRAGSKSELTANSDSNSLESNSKFVTPKSDFVVGDLVFAKMKGYEHWPAKITSLHKKSKVSKYGVFFFGSNDTAILPKESIVTYNEMSKEQYGKIENIAKALQVSFRYGMQEIDNSHQCLARWELSASRLDVEPLGNLSTNSEMNTVESNSKLVPSKADFIVGDLVFAKVTGYPHWPAKITSLDKKGKYINYGVFFFGTHETATQSKESIVMYNKVSKEKHGKIKLKKSMWQSFRNSIEEIESIEPCLGVESWGKLSTNSDINTMLKDIQDGFQ